LVPAAVTVVVFKLTVLLLPAILITGPALLVSLLSVKTAFTGTDPPPALVRLSAEPVPVVLIVTLFAVRAAFGFWSCIPSGKAVSGAVAIPEVVMVTSVRLCVRLPELDTIAGALVVLMMVPPGLIVRLALPERLMADWPTVVIVICPFGENGLRTRLLLPPAVWVDVKFWGPLITCARDCSDASKTEASAAKKISTHPALGPAKLTRQQTPALMLPDLLARLPTLAPSRINGGTGKPRG
jgi:hypothetical protein